MQELLLRLVWSNNGWTSPSGAHSDGGWPKEHGYGMEEWNFQTNDAVEGAIYGYSLYTPRESIAGQELRIGFWTLHPRSRQRQLVGIYERAQYVEDKEEFKILHTQFKNYGIYDRRIQELVDLGISRVEARKNVIDSVKGHWLHFKCNVNHITTYPDQSRPVLRVKTEYKSISNYFRRATLVDAIEDFIDPSLTSDFTRNPLSEDGYIYRSQFQIKKVLLRYNELSNRFRKWLEKNNAHNITQENNRVDVTYLDRDDNTVKVEIKICSEVGSTKGIRESLGQLLEYNYYDTRNPAKKWIILLDIKPSGADIEYLHRVSKTHKFPIGIGWEISPKNGGYRFELLDPLGN